MSNDINSRIEDALNQIRPFLQADGGDVKFLEITPEMVVKLELEGACKSCSMRMMTFKAGLEETLKRSVPEIRGVEAVNLHAEVTE
jgi:Fe-S cluster biogenesis protein NfuA